MADFKMQRQEQTEWCWAAVAVSIHNYLRSASAPVLTQGALANTVLGTSVDCTLHPELCNHTAPLKEALRKAGVPSTDADGNILFSALVESIDKKLPVCVQIDWFGHHAGAHAIAIDGYQEYSSGAQAVVVQDPNAGPSIHFYEDVVENYPPGGRWSHTFKVKA